MVRICPKGAHYGSVPVWCIWCILLSQKHARVYKTQVLYLYLSCRSQYGAVSSDLMVHQLELLQIAKWLDYRSPIALSDPLSLTSAPRLT